MISLHPGNGRHMVPKAAAVLAMCIAASAGLHAQDPVQLTVRWDKTTVVSKSTPTLQVVVNPPLRHGEPLSAASYKAVK